MSLNISGTKFVRVYDTEIKLQVSDKIVFAHLSTSRKTGKEQVDKETGEILMGKDGEPLQERRFSSWDARFVGQAFEPSKGLSAGAAINIINGWVTNEPFKRKDGTTGYALTVTISEFEACDIAEGVDNESAEDNNPYN